MTDVQAGNENPQVESETVDRPVETQERNDEKKGNYYQKKLAEAIAEKESLSKQLEEEKQAKLREQNNYKELWELEKNKRSQAEEKATKVTQSYFNGLRMSAIEQEALKLGIHESALEDLSLMNTELVQIETTSTGNAHVLGAKEFAEMLKEKKPYLFKNMNAPKFNGSNPSEVKSKELSNSEILALQRKDPSAYKEYMFKTRGFK